MKKKENYRLYKCDSCGLFKEDSEMNLILGVYVCEKCYPKGKEYNCYSSSEGEFSNSKYAYQCENPIDYCQRDFDYELMMCKDCKDYNKCLKRHGKDSSQKKLF